MDDEDRVFSFKNPFKVYNQVEILKLACQKCFAKSTRARARTPFAGKFEGHIASSLAGHLLSHNGLTQRKL